MQIDLMGMSIAGMANCNESMEMLCPDYNEHSDSSGHLPPLLVPIPVFVSEHV